MRSVNDSARGIDDLAAIRAALDLYFDGLYHSDTTRLRQVLHPAALYAAVMEGTLKALDMEKYWSIVDKRESPASRGEVRRDTILHIDQIGAVTAMAQVQCAIGLSWYTDLLSLLKVDGRWWIVAKVFQVNEI